MSSFVKKDTHLEQFPEVGTARRQHHLVGLHGKAVGRDGDVDKLLLVLQLAERRHHVVVVVAPFQAVVLFVGGLTHGGGGGGGRWGRYRMSHLPYLRAGEREGSADSGHTGGGGR